MKEFGFLFMLFSLGMILVALFQACRNKVEKCVHLYDIRKHKIKCMKCGLEEWK